MPDSRASTLIKLTLVAPTAFGALALGGCDDETSLVHTYESPQGCITQGVYTADYCRAAFEMAQKENEASAPQFASKEECENAFESEPSNSGQMCLAKEIKDELAPAAGTTAGVGTQSHNHSSFVYIPLMQRYMVSESGGRALYGSGRSGSFFTSSGSSVPVSSFNNKAGAKVSPSTFRSAPVPSSRSSGTSTTWRGGFGSSAHSVSGSHGMSAGG